MQNVTNLFAPDEVTTIKLNELENLIQEKEYYKRKYEMIVNGLKDRDVSRYAILKMLNIKDGDNK